MSTPTTPLNNFYEGCVQLIIREVLPEIVEHFAKKNIRVTEEELLEVLNMEKFLRPSTPSMISSVSGTTTRGPRKTAKDKAVAPPISTGNPARGVTCSYKFLNGMKKGQFCERPVVAGTDYCRSCTTTTKNRETAKRKKAESAAGILPGVAPAFLPVADNQDVLETDEYDRSNDLVIHRASKYIVNVVGSDIFGVVGKDLAYDVKAHPQRNPQPLEEADYADIEQLGLQVVSEQDFPYSRLVLSEGEVKHSAPIVPSIQPPPIRAPVPDIPDIRKLGELSAPPSLHQAARSRLGK